MIAVDIANLMLKHRADNLSATHFSEVLDTLMWSLDHELGNTIVVARANWLRGEDRYAAEVALKMESCPFTSRKEMTDVLNSIAARWPELSGLCKEVQEWCHPLLPDEV